MREDRNMARQTTDFPDALPGETRLTHGLSPFEPWAKLKMLEMVPSCDNHRCTQAVLWSPVSFVLRPSLSPLGGRMGDLISIPPPLLAWAPDTHVIVEPGSEGGCEAAMSIAIAVKEKRSPSWHDNVQRGKGQTSSQPRTRQLS